MWYTSLMMQRPVAPDTGPAAEAAAVYLDTSGHLWSSDREVLHAFAQLIGLRRPWFQDRPRLYHYDVMSGRIRMLAYRAGAVDVTPRELIALIQATNLPPQPGGLGR